MAESFQSGKGGTKSTTLVFLLVSTEVAVICLRTPKGRVHKTTSPKDIICNFRQNLSLNISVRMPAALIPVNVVVWVGLRGL